ncbi:sugar ABC transporter substrate-binding protein [Planctomycetales bacterium]|nr:sugar ABC transporter substrate-binding protein [Planctomycetales bacterium]
MNLRSFLFLFFTAVLLAGCGGDDAAPPPESRDALLRRFMPQAMADGGVKIAAIINLTDGDFSRQFLRGCAEEGAALGFRVETFCTGGDDEQCQELLRKIIAADYDGIILSHGGNDWAYRALAPAVSKGIKVVTFDTLPYPDADDRQPILTGVTATAQEDTYLAELSLAALVGSFPAERRPLRVIRVSCPPGILPLDRRQRIYDRYVASGDIKEVAFVTPASIAQAREGAAASLAKTLPQLPVGAADAIWAPYDELAKGALAALLAANRRDLPLFSVDISNEDLQLMQQNPLVWRATAAVDPQLIGIGEVRILAAKFAGEKNFDTYVFSAQLLYAADLKKDTRMENLVTRVNGWEKERGLIDDYLWMIEIKRAAK